MTLTLVPRKKKGGGGPLPQGINMCNMKALSLTIKKLWSVLKFLQMNRQTDGAKTICPNLSDQSRITGKFIVRDQISRKISMHPSLCFLLTPIDSKEQNKNRMSCERKFYKENK